MKYTKQQVLEIIDKIDNNELIKVRLFLEVDKKPEELDFYLTN